MQTTIAINEIFTDIFDFSDFHLHNLISSSFSNQNQFQIFLTIKSLFSCFCAARLSRNPMIDDVRAAEAAHVRGEILVVDY